MSLIYYALRLGAHLTKTEIGLLACIGIATLLTGAALTLAWSISAVKLGIAAHRRSAELRALESGTLDGLRADKIADLLDEFWILNDSGAIDTTED